MNGIVNRPACLRRALPRLLLATVAACAAVGVQAQQFLGTKLAPEGAPPRLVVEPRLRLEGYAPLDGSGAEPSLRVGAGLGLRAHNADLKGLLDYQIQARLAGSNGQSVDQLAALQADWQWWRGQGFLGVNGSISRTAASAFSAVPLLSGQQLGQSTELRRLRLAPRWEGTLVGELTYRASVYQEWQRARGNPLGRVDSSGFNGQLGREGRGVVGAALLVDAERWDYAASRAFDSVRAYGQASFMVRDWDLQGHLNAGVESSTLQSAQRERTAYWGVGGQWQPSNRTRISGQFDKRGFGNAYSLQGEYRTALTAWNLSLSRQVSQSSAGSSTGSLFDLLMLQAASVERDPNRRIELVMNTLKRLGPGWDPLQQVAIPSYLSGALTLNQAFSLSHLWRLDRSMVTVQLGQSRARRLDDTLNLVDDFNLSKDIRVRRLSLGVDHRLTPVSSVGLLVAVSRNDAMDRANLASQMREVQASYRADLSPDAAATLTLRHSSSTQSTAASSGSSSDSAVLATYDMRF